MSTRNYLRTAALAAGGAATAAIIFVGVKADRLARIGAGYKAKVACSEIFLAGRDPEIITGGEFIGMDPMMEKISVTPDMGNREVRASGPFGLGHARAAYRDGYGCTLANGGRIMPLPEMTASAAAAPWPEAPPASGGALARVDYGALDAALNDAFENNTTHHRAVLVVVNGKIIDERYADGFTKETPFLSWSAAKSVTAALVGAAALRGYIDINEPAPVPEWQGDARRSQITWNDLLRMQSGLEFSETYDDMRSDVTRTLFEMADAGAIAAKGKVLHAPGAAWYYSSGTTNLISRTLRQVLTGAGVDYHAFAREAVFNPMGAASFVMEPDALGTFIGSSFVYATARDWARLGQLYLQDGIWEGARLAPEGWTHYVTTPASAADNQYGAHFWLNRDGESGRTRYFPGLPEDVYFMAGFEGQYVFIIPSKKTIIVRTGMTRGQPEMEAVRPLMEAIYDAIGNAPGAGLD